MESRSSNRPTSETAAGERLVAGAHRGRASRHRPWRLGRRPGPARRQLLPILLSAGLLVGMLVAPATTAAADPGPSAPTATGSRSNVGLISPTPQSVEEGSAVRLDGRVAIVTGADTDEQAIEALRRILASSGSKVSRARPGASPHRGATVVYLGTTKDNPMIRPALRQIGVSGGEALSRPEGYVLGAGRAFGHHALVLAGADGRGTFYAVQTLRQILRHGRVAPVTVHDWPLMSIRGAIEGFYGIPWSHQARLDQLAFYGRHKMNTYIYTPKDDRLLRAEWRTLYSGAALRQISELISTANANHVDFTFALSPGNDICYSSQADFDATIAKFEQLRGLGVTSFYVALDDIPLSFHCDADKARYPNQGDWHWLADAQADYLNRIQREYVEPNGLAPLQTVPTNYAGSGEDPYKGEFGERLDDDVRVQWTGEGVFSDTITVESVTRASQSYRTEHLYIWDNFPVNDGRRNRLFLNPLTGRAPGLYQHIDGITSNPMIEPYASMPALFNYGDYTWNPLAYDADASMAAALRELAGPKRAVRSALTTFADLNQSWPYRDDVVYAPLLNRDIDAFWVAYDDHQSAGTRALRDRLDQITRLPRTLPKMAEPGFAADAEPWIDAAAQWAEALRHEIAMLDAIHRGRGEKATDEMLAALDWIAKTKQPTVDDQGSDGVLRENVIVPSVGDGAFDAFSERALAVYTDWIGAELVQVPTYPASASSSMGTYSSYAVANMVDGNASTLYWSNEAGRAGAWVQVDLGEVREVGSVAVHQSDSDDAAGDMFYDAMLEYSTDGTSWTQAGRFTSAPLVKSSFASPVQARYVRLRAVADNPGGQWVKIREFEVSPTTGVFETNLAPVAGEGPERAFDADVTTAYRAATRPVPGSYLARNLDQPQQAREVIVVGTGVGQIQVRNDGSWTTVGDLRRGRGYHEARIDRRIGAAVTGVRVLFEAGSVTPEIHEVVLRGDS